MSQSVAESGARPTRLLRWGIVALALLVALIAWLATRDGGGSSSPSGAAPPRTLTEAELTETAAGAKHPIYWAGPEVGAEYELVEVEGGGVQVLYVPEGTRSEAASVGALTIGSYPLADPAKAIAVLAAQPGAIVRRNREGREVVSNTQRPTNVYFASPDNSVQVEIYDPSPQRAMRLALSGHVRPAP